MFKTKYMTNNSNNTPQLRFPGFTGEWAEKKLSEVATSFSGGTPKSSEPTYYGGSIPFIRSGEIHGSETALFITEEGLNNSSAKLVNKGDLLYALYGATSGDVAISKINGAINQVILCIRSEEINSCFLCNYLEKVKNLITSRYLQGGQGNLSGDIIMSLNIPFTSTAEQEKIADCLSTMDTLIAAQRQKVEALKERKRGLMQQLFLQQGETTPRLRFPGFTDNWQEKKLCESFTERVEKRREDLPLLSLGEEGLAYQSDTARKDNSNQDKSKYLRVAIGDIAYNTMRMWQGRCVYVDIEGIVSPAYTVCKPKRGIDSRFHYYLFKTHRMISKFHQHSQGLVSDTLNLKYHAFSKIKYLLPPSLAEQEKIAACLIEIDALIAAETAKLEALKVHKRGLMQQLFPQTSK
jgi:type I restriction enzyme S subunit